MRAFSASLLLSLLLAVPLASSCVYITELHPNPQEPRNEWTELYNSCGEKANLSGLCMADASHEHSISCVLKSATYAVIANNASLFQESFNATDVCGLGGVNYWMNNNGDNITLLNRTPLSSVSYGDSEKGLSLSLCNGTWSWRVPTPGRANNCTNTDSEHNESGVDVTNITDAPDYSGITVSAACPQKEVRFGDFALVRADISTGGSSVPLRIVAYIYSPRWVSTDLDGETIRSRLNDTGTALEIETGNEESITLHLPLLVRSDCDEEYQDGIYTGRARIYMNATDDVVAEDRYNITINGNNGLFCCSCPECPECECRQRSCRCPACDCSEDGGNEEKEREPIKLLGLPANVTEGVAFSTSVRIENTERSEKMFSVYSYSYEGSRCLTQGFDGRAWSRAWSANRNDTMLGPGESAVITLRNAFENGTEPGMHTFRVRLRVDGGDHDITERITVMKAPLEEPSEQPADEHEENLTGNVLATGMSVTASREGPEAEPGIYEALIAWIASLLNFNNP